MEEGFVINLEECKGRPGKYQTTPEAVEQAAMLPTAEEVQERLDNPPPDDPPSKIAQPCNPEEKAEDFQSDNGCAETRNPEVRTG